MTPADPEQLVPEQLVPEQLVAVTRPLPDPVDLLAVAGERGALWLGAGVGLAAMGEAARIEVPRSGPAAAAAAVTQVLESIEVDGDLGPSGSGPVALGALPFDVSRPGEMVVPELIVGEAGDGTRWVTTISRRGHRQPDLGDLQRDLRELQGRAVSQPGAARHVISSERPPQEWCDSVAKARDSLRGGAASKVVLARAVGVEADRPIPRLAVLRHLAMAYPGCMIYGIDGLVGASPELLVSRMGSMVRSHPMAGTTARSGNPAVDDQLAAELVASVKDQAEHRITIDMVHDTLLPWCSYLDEEAEPSVVAMANVAHLATRVEGQLSSPPASVVELMTALHPTPAVCGWPREAAMGLIAEHEDLERGRYAGPVGWVDSRGDGEWAVGIRCAEITGARARLFAGVGVMPDSDPLAELAETQAKLQALLAAIVRP